MTKFQTALDALILWLAEAHRFRRHRPPPSFPRRRESGPLDSGNIQRLSESLVMVGWASAHRFRRHQMPCRASDGIRGLVG
ncbi:hypothetical protein [Neisseria lactamica]|uniref:hypothetical protein n=1 Tax=Neisseria lactamica TaxID=486 RepID=UPI000E58FF7B|nr:hypothetical protein [Neisseria lactamica]